MHRADLVRTDKLVTLPVETVERLIDIAAGARGVNDAPALMVFSEVRLQIERAKRLQVAVSAERSFAAEVTSG